jgi:diguanylate cyclase (GGDEF)-like protein
MTAFRSGTESHSENGLFSFSQIMYLMRVEYARAQRYRYPLVCMLIGIDDLAQLRDSFGYEAKETVIEETARELQALTRSCDFLGRLVDDKLLAVVPHTDVEGAVALSERLRAGVSALSFGGGRQDLHVTVSVGIAHTKGEDNLFFDTLIEAAKEAQEQAASAGGDRVVVRDPSGPHGR